MTIGGFYNGANTNASLLPERYTATSGGAWSLVPGSNRDPNVAACRKGMLTKLVYPTGGYTTFEYELNEYGFVERATVPSHVVLGAPRSVSVSTLCAYQVPGNTIACSGAGSTRTFRIAGRQRIRVDWSIQQPYFTDQDGNEQGPTLSMRCQDSTKHFGPFRTKYITGANCTAARCTFGPTYYDVEPGVYTIEARVAPPEIAGSATLSITYRDSIGVSPNLPAGGTRIKRMTDSPTGLPSAETSRVFSYTMAGDPSRSSGCLVNPLPDYYYNFQYDSQGDCNGNTYNGVTYTPRFFKVRWSS